MVPDSFSPPIEALTPPTTGLDLSVKNPGPFHELKPGLTFENTVEQFRSNWRQTTAFFDTLKCNHDAQIQSQIELFKFVLKGLCGGTELTVPVVSEFEVQAQSIFGVYLMEVTAIRGRLQYELGMACAELEQAPNWGSLVRDILDRVKMRALWVQQQHFIGLFESHRNAQTALLQAYARGYTINDQDRTKIAQERQMPWGPS